MRRPKKHLVFLRFFSYLIVFCILLYGIMAVFAVFVVILVIYVIIFVLKNLFKFIYKSRNEYTKRKRVERVCDVRENKSKEQKQKRMRMRMSDEQLERFMIECNAYVQRNQDMEEYKKYYNIKDE